MGIATWWKERQDEAAMQVREEGREEGLEEGLEKGLQQGREEGRAEMRTKTAKWLERRMASGEFRLGRRRPAARSR